jgi:glycosyltransferase involved in cell wall biosynthesis
MNSGSIAMTSESQDFAALTPRESRGERKSTVRVLHVVAQMRPGGVETWLMRVLRQIDRSRFQVDFLVHTTEPRPYDEEIRRLGGKILPCLDPNRPLRYRRQFLRLLSENGPYDVVHSHIHYYSGFVLRLAHEADVPIRIAHCHSDTALLESGSSWLRRTYIRWMQRSLLRYATLGLAASAGSAAALYGEDWVSDPRFRVHHCGVALDSFREPVDSAAIRRELGIPEGSRVVGHVGRISLPKNHQFWIEIARELAARNPQLHFLLVGDGELRAEVVRWVKEAGLASRFTLPGPRHDVARVLRGAIDVFLFPSTWEGLPVAMVEAQAAGRPCVYSDIVSPEVEVVPDLLTRLSLNLPASAWAERIENLLHQPPGVSQPEALAAVESSSFNIQRDVAELERIYAGRD